MNIKERLKNGEMVFGTWNSIPSASVVNAICCSGIDFIVIDAEHGPVSMETAENLIRAAEVAGSTPIVRVPNNQSHIILRALDIGAHGVQVPHVSTKEQAEKVVSYAKYYPAGDRGFTPFTRAGKYGINAAGHTERSNEHVLVVVNVEGIEGLNRLEEIVSVPEIDVIFLGPYDISQSLGKPGKVDDPEIIAHIRKGVDIITDRGLSCGSFARDMHYLDVLIDCGVQYITYTVDSNVLAETYRDMYREFNKKKKPK